VQPCVSLYGLGVRFNRPLAGLRGLPAREQADVRVYLGDLPRDLRDVAAVHDLYIGDTPLRGSAPAVRFSEIGHGAFYRFAYADGTRIVVDRAGENVWASVPEGATDEDTGTYLLGPTLGFVLRLRGLVCLHASVIEVDANAIAFAGAAGAGKSSIAAAFAKRGHRVLTDDVSAFREFRGRVHVVPAYPRIRLWPDSVNALFGSREALPRITPTWDKRYLDLNGAQRPFTDEPLPLAAIYLLHRGEPDRIPSIEVLRPRDALMSLVPEMYSTRLLDGAMRAREFDFLSRLVGALPVRRLTSPGDLARIEEACEVVLREATARCAA
jgi:hypothetical protein